VESTASSRTILRLEKLFEMYTQMTARQVRQSAVKNPAGRKRKGADA